MQINVAGAGAGKTTAMARRLLSDMPPKGKIIYCLAFTHSAVDNIKEKIICKLGNIPDQLWIGTIHSFLYQEIINPFHFILYGQHFRTISDYDLPSDIPYKKARLAELNNCDILHRSQIPEIAKWVISGKSNDKSLTKSLRKTIFPFISSYCHKIVVDEAQDIDKHMMSIFIALDKAGISIELHGDPKQDIKGYNCYRELINLSKNVFYSNLCYRCPARHLSLSNTLAPAEEQQVADPNNKEGIINVLYESDLSISQEYLNQFGLCYIHQKNDRFLTHFHNNISMQSLHYEIKKAMQEKHANAKTEAEIAREAYYISECIFNADNPQDELKRWINNKAFDYTKQSYARIMSIMSVNKSTMPKGLYVQSIESIKGLESDNCLFILTTDLVPYLTGDNREENKMKHLLYVALTRSLEKITILVSKEVETKYGRTIIQNAIINNLSN